MMELIEPGIYLAPRLRTGSEETVTKDVEGSSKVAPSQAPLERSIPEEFEKDEEERHVHISGLSPELSDVPMPTSASKAPLLSGESKPFSSASFASEKSSVLGSLDRQLMTHSGLDLLLGRNPDHQEAQE
jgi:hypothetical protein